MGAALETRYARSWRSDLRLWEQTGRHTVHLGPLVMLTVDSRALISETDGVTAFTVTQGSRLLLDASLDTIGLAGDVGIPAWTAPVTRAPLPATA